MKATKSSFYDHNKAATIKFFGSSHLNVPLKFDLLVTRIWSPLKRSFSDGALWSLFILVMELLVTSVVATTDRH